MDERGVGYWVMGYGEGVMGSWVMFTGGRDINVNTEPASRGGI